jgi:hypothetical protein
MIFNEMLSLGGDVPVHNRVHYDKDFLTLMIEWKSREMRYIEQETRMDHSRY